MTGLPTLVFVDTETTHLHPDLRRAWEIAYILRKPGEIDVERTFYIEVGDLDLSMADPASLRLGGYYERHPDPYGDKAQRSSSGMAGAFMESAVAPIIAQEWRNAVLVGATVSFDERTIADMLGRTGLSPTWDYHLLDVVAYAAGSIGLVPPINLQRLCRAYAVEQVGAHTALGDAQAVRDLWDAVHGNAKPPTAIGPTAKYGYWAPPRDYGSVPIDIAPPE